MFIFVESRCDILYFAVIHSITVLNAFVICGHM